MASYENSSCDDFSLDGEYGTFPTEFQYSIDSRIDVGFSTSEGGAEEKAKILLMGLRGVGKSSILKVVFHKMTPTETLFLEGTNKIEKDDIANNSFVQFQIWDFPGQIDFFEEDFDAGQILTGRDAVVFVLDAQEEYEDALIRLHETIVKGHQINPNLKFEVFIHKVDGLTDDSKIDTQRAIQQRLSDELEDAGLQEVQPCFHLTSIYDHSVFEAFSKVVQKLIVHLASLEKLLNILVQHSGVDKAFLFDVVSKIYIATDSGPVDIQSYELCCDMIDIVIDISCIYSAKEDGEMNAYDTETASVIRLTDSTVCYLREVNRFMALVCIMREESFTKQGLINYNFNCFRQAIQQIFKVREQAQNSNTMSA